tara:strand:- start:536 stop:2428 length:1893 start_codon:yes stop_codon:yes gene_type:complete
MKLPSISYILQSAKKSFSRFPSTIISALIVTVISIYMIEISDEMENFSPLMNICLTFGLGISLYLAVSLYAEKNKVNSKLKWGSFLLATIVLLLIHNTLPASEVEASKIVPYINFTIYSIISHLLVAFLPYFNSKQENGFWNYNKGLFIRFATVYLYALVLYAGFAFSLFSLDLLFDIDLHYELFGELWIFISVLFSSWFFVSGIPENLDDLEKELEYPKGLKTFGQYILLPLVILYCVILFAYGAKIVLVWDWPKGMVTYMISAYSVLGILTFLLLYPWGKLEESAWVKKFSKLFYILMLPLVVLLFFAVSIRISEYGITINRYLVVVMGIWLAMVSLYFSVGKTNIKFVPTSLSAILIVMMVGPWGMFSISEKSQSERLIELLEKNDLLVDGKIISEPKWQMNGDGNFIYKSEYKNQELIEREDYLQVESIVDYLEDYHGFSAIYHIFKQNIDSLITEAKIESNWVSEDRVIMETLGLDFNTWKYETKEAEVLPSNRHEYSIANNLDFTDISGYDYYLREFVYSHSKELFNINGGNFDMYIDSLDFILSIDNIEKEKVDLGLKEITEKLLDKYGTNYWIDNISLSDMTYITESEDYNIKVIYTMIQTEELSSSYRVNSVYIDLFLKNK